MSISGLKGLMIHIYILFSHLGFHGAVLTVIYFLRKSVVLSVYCCLYLILKAQFVQLLLQDERFAFNKDIQLDSVFAAVKAKVRQVKTILISILELACRLASRDISILKVVVRETITPRGICLDCKVVSTESKLENGWMDGR